MPGGRKLIGWLRPLDPCSACGSALRIEEPPNARLLRKRSEIAALFGGGAISWMLTSWLPLILGAFLAIVVLPSVLSHRGRLVAEPKEVASPEEVPEANEAEPPARAEMEQLEAE